MISNYKEHVPATTDTVVPVSFTHGGLTYRPAIVILRNTTDVVVSVKMRSSSEAEAVAEDPTDFDQYFKMASNKEYSFTAPKGFDTVITKAASTPGSGNFQINIVDYDSFNA